MAYSDGAAATNLWVGTAQVKRNQWSRQLRVYSAPWRSSTSRTLARPRCRGPLLAGGTGQLGLSTATSRSFCTRLRTERRYSSPVPAHPPLHLRWVGLRRRPDGIIQQIGEHGDQIHPAKGEIPRDHKGQNTRLRPAGRLPRTCGSGWSPASGLWVSIMVVLAATAFIYTGNIVL